MDITTTINPIRILTELKPVVINNKIEQDVIRTTISSINIQTTINPVNFVTVLGSRLVPASIVSSVYLKTYVLEIVGDITIPSNERWKMTQLRIGNGAKLRVGGGAELIVAK